MLLAVTVMAFAYLATLYVILLLVTWHRGVPSVGTVWGRKKVLHASVQPEESHFALKAGQTIIGVMETTRALCFYIDHERREDTTCE